MSSTKVAPKAPKAASTTREYVILMADRSVTAFHEVWHAIGHGTGATPKQAMTAVVEDLAPDERDGTFVAVPMRNWSPLTRTTQTVVKANWS